MSCRLLLFICLLLAPAAVQADSPLLARCNDISRPFDALPACNAVVADSATSASDLVAARIARGNLYGTMRQFDRAIADYTEVMKQQPDLGNVLVNRGICYESINQGPKALADYDRAIQLGPDKPGGYAARGGYWGRKNDLDKAMPDLDAALRLNPGDAATRLNRGAAWATKGDHAAAIADFNVAITRQPSALAYYNRCTSRAITGQLPEALEDCNQALFLRSNFPEVLGSRGLVYLRMKQPDQALRDYDLAIQMQPKSAAALFGRGLAKLALNDRPGAQADMAAARKADPAIDATFKRWGVPGG